MPGSDDLVARLRSSATDKVGGWHNVYDTCGEAADEIERLNAALASRDKKIERLTEELSDLQTMFSANHTAWGKALEDAEASEALAATAARELDEARAEVERLRKVVFIVAPSHQGGHSRTGDVIAEALGVPFPVRMEEVVPAAIKAGLDPVDLWPWSDLARAALTAKGGENAEG